MASAIFTSENKLNGVAVENRYAPNFWSGSCESSAFIMNHEFEEKIIVFHSQTDSLFMSEK